MVGRRGLAFTISSMLVALISTSCAPPPEPPDGWTQRFLTRDGADVVTITTDGADMDVRAPASNGGSNSRVLFGEADAPSTVDQSSCATTTHSGGTIQDGVAVRMRTDGERHRAVTVTKNIWLGAKYTYNVHLWDSTITNALGARQISSFDLTTVLAVESPDGMKPRRLCVSVTGRTLSFKVWYADEPEPAWSDPTHVKTVTLPVDWVFAGRPGAYIGHVNPGGWARFTDLAPADT